MYLFWAFISGLIFGLGLILSGMTNPANIIGFLNITGQWNAALMFVMVGAISVSFFGFKYAKKRGFTLLGDPITLPSNSEIDFKLIGGAALFGIGWGLAGFCPGPAIASLLTRPHEAGLFVVAMLAGMGIYELIKK